MSLYNTHGQKNNDQNKRKIKNKSRKKASVKNISNIYNYEHAMTMKVYFPTGIVTGQAFCNREHERDYLKRRLDQNTHIVLMSPRRYGKSSLIAQFTEDQKIPFCSIDLLPATSDKYVKNAVVDGVTQLLGEMMPASKKAKQKLLGYFSRMNPAIELSAFGQKIKLNPDEKTPEETIM